MNKLLQFLKENNFEQETQLERLKVTLSAVKHQDNNTDIQSRDIRYYWDDKTFGLHISKSQFVKLFWLGLFDVIESASKTLSVLYIGNTTLAGNLDFSWATRLTYLNLSKNKTLETLKLSNLSALEELNTSFCPNLEKVELIGRFDALKKLDVSYAKKLSKIVFPNSFSKLRFFYAQKTNLEADYLDISTYYEEELREKLSSFLLFKHLIAKDEWINPNRYQVIFIGNTTAGKTELRLALTDTERKPEESISTHGVQTFTHKIGDKEIFGYDFGGQDYYHATHLPFFDDKTLYVLVWGNYHDWKRGNGDPTTFGIKTETVNGIGTENIIYPLDYWLGSLLYGKDIGRNETLGTGIKEKRKLEIIQNLRKDNTTKFYLNNKELKENRWLDVGDIADFDIYSNKAKAKKWLEDRILDQNLLDNQPISKATYDFGRNITNQGKAFFSPTELIKKFTEANNPRPKKLLVYFNGLAESLNRNRFGFLHRTLQSFFIARIDVFSSYIHKILSKELATKDQNAGYFTLEEAKSRLVDTKITNEETQFIINFLVEENVIFRVENTSSFIAPAYLPIPKNKVDLLLIESFEEPDCYWEFESYFHSNIMLQIIKDKKDNLIYDDTLKEYLLWKNTILIYSESEKNSQNYLLIKLEYPDDNLKKPRLSLSRNKAKYVSDEDFKAVFEYLANKLQAFEHPKAWVKTPYNQEGIAQYIPFKLIEKCDENQKGKFAHLIYYEDAFFNRFSFKHFKEMGTKMPKKIFVAYSKSDDEFRYELRNHLRPYEKSGELIIFDDRDIDLGSVWDAELKKQLIECDIFLCLISINTLNTAYVVDLEIPEATKLGKKIIPLILSSCNWQDKRYGLSDYFATDKGKALNLDYTEFALYKENSRSLDKFERAEKWTKLAEKIIEQNK